MSVRFMWGMLDGEHHSLWANNAIPSNSFVLPDPTTGLLPLASSARMAYFPGRYPNTKLLGFASGSVSIASSAEVTIDLGVIGDQTIVVGFAFSVLADALASAYNGALVYFVRESTNNNELGSLEISSTGELIAQFGTARPTGFFPVPGAHYYIEIKYRPHNTTGYLELRVNGEVIMSFVGDTTSQSNGLYVGKLTFVSKWAAGNNLRCYRQYGDIYVLDEAGTINDFLGDSVVQRLYPSGSGSKSEFVGSDSNSTDNYALVNNPIPDQSRFVESNVVGARDLYAMTNLTGATGDIVAVQTSIHASKQSSGYGSLAPVLKSGASETVGTLGVISTTTLGRLKDQIFETSPASSGPWTPSEIDALEVGVEVGNV